LGISELARERSGCGSCRTGKLKLKDFSGGTFTVSNLGMYMSMFLRYINPP